MSTVSQRERKRLQLATRDRVREAMAGSGWTQNALAAACNLKCSTGISKISLQETVGLPSIEMMELMLKVIATQKAPDSFQYGGSPLKSQFAHLKRVG